MPILIGALLGLLASTPFLSAGMALDRMNQELSSAESFHPRESEEMKKHFHLQEPGKIEMIEKRKKLDCVLKMLHELNEGIRENRLHGTPIPDKGKEQCE